MMMTRPAISLGARPGCRPPAKAMAALSPTSQAVASASTRRYMLGAYTPVARARLAVWGSRQDRRRAALPGAWRVYAPPKVRKRLDFSRNVAHYAYVFGRDRNAGNPRLVPGLLVG
jgi:hypothetical protein